MPSNDHAIAFTWPNVNTNKNKGEAMLRSPSLLPQAGRARPHSLRPLVAMSCCLFVLTVPPLARSQAKDPGPRGGAAAAGTYYPTLNSNEQLLFNQALARFQEVDSVSGGIEPGRGLGPAFNGNSCAMCHSRRDSLCGMPPGYIHPRMAECTICTRSRDAPMPRAAL